MGPHAITDQSCCGAKDHGCPDPDPHRLKAIGFEAALCSHSIETRQNGNHYYSLHGEAPMNTKPLFYCFAVSIIVGCGGGGGGGGAESTGNLSPTGTFHDSAVQGLNYIAFDPETLDIFTEGTTNSSGEFSYVEGGLVEFSYGRIVLGKATGREILTPADLIDNSDPNPWATLRNMLRVLQTLDTDLKPDNGLSLPVSGRPNSAPTINSGTTIFDQISEVDFEADIHGNLNFLPPPLVDKTTAENHFNATMVRLSSNGYQDPRQFWKSPPQPPITEIPTPPASIAHAILSILKIEAHVLTFPIAAPASSNWEYSLIDPDGITVSTCRVQKLGPEISRLDPAGFFGATFCGSDTRIISTPQPELLGRDFEIVSQQANVLTQPKPGTWSLAVQPLPALAAYIGIDVRACSAVGIFDLDPTGPDNSAICNTNDAPLTSIDVGQPPIVVATGTLTHVSDTDGYIADLEPNDNIESANRIWDSTRGFSTFPAGFEANESTPSSDFYVFTAEVNTTYRLSLDSSAPSSSTANFDLFIFNSSGGLIDSSQDDGPTEFLDITLSEGTTIYIEVRADSLPMTPNVGHYFYHLNVGRPPIGGVQ